MEFTINVKECPDTTYFVAGDVRPTFENGVLTICEGRGTRRSWGAPSVRSEITQLSDTVFQVEVVGWHKHTVSPVGGYYYFVFTGKGKTWERKSGNAKAVKLAKAEYSAVKAA